MCLYVPLSNVQVPKCLFILSEIRNQKMNREDLVETTAKLAVYMKSLNFKLCRKGLLEQAKGVDLQLVEFSSLENAFLKSIVSTNGHGQNAECLNKFKKNTSAKMDSEIKSLTEQVGLLSITIKNSKERVRLGTNVEFYSTWVKKIDSLSKRFKQK